MRARYKYSAVAFFTAVIYAKDARHASTYHPAGTLGCGAAAKQPKRRGTPAFRMQCDVKLHEAQELQSLAGSR